MYIMLNLTILFYIKYINLRHVLFQTKEALDGFHLEDNPKSILKVLQVLAFPLEIHLPSAANYPMHVPIVKDRLNPRQAHPNPIISILYDIPANLRREQQFPLLQPKRLHLKVLRGNRPDRIPQRIAPPVLAGGRCALPS